MFLNRLAELSHYYKWTGFLTSRISFECVKIRNLHWFKGCMDLANAIFNEPSHGDNLEYSASDL